MNTEYAAYIAHKRNRHGDKFDDTDLAPQFIPYFGTGVRIKVQSRFSDERAYFGTVGVTTGWKPVFILLKRSDSMGSWITLSPDDRILAVKRNGKYVNL